MQKLQTAGLVSFVLLALFIASNLTPSVSAQQARGVLGIERGARITVVYTVSTTQNDTISDAEFVDQTADWLIVSNKRRTMIPVKNIVRIEIGKGR